MFDYMIIGCGLSGATCARLLAEKGKRVLIIEKRNHIAGNTYDYYDEHGILVHKYGPHIFHTPHKKVWDFLSRFTKWYNYQHKVLAFINGASVPMPINLDTINTLYGTNYTSFTVGPEFLDKLGDSNMTVENARDMVISKVGQELYDLFFKNYTKKQWGVYPEELDKEVTARIPLRHNRDDRYFTDQYQGMPARGYTYLVQNMLDHTNIHLMLSTDYRDIMSDVNCRHIICSAPIDEFFNYKFGKLPYRSIHFEWETYDLEQYQNVAVVNYPNDYDFTRITEFKHMTGQVTPKTTLVKEYPNDSGEPYYPVPRKENRELYDRYWYEAEKELQVSFIGRLGLYKYANMDVVVKDAMELVESFEEW